MKDCLIDDCFVHFFYVDEYRAPGSSLTAKRRYKPTKPSIRQDWPKFYDFALSMGNGKLDDIIELWNNYKLTSADDQSMIPY